MVVKGRQSRYIAEQTLTLDNFKKVEVFTYLGSKVTNTNDLESKQSILWHF